MQAIISLISQVRQAMPLSDAGLGVLPISVGDVLFALILAFFILLIHRLISRFFAAIFSPGRYLGSPEHRKIIMKKCYELFPIKSLHFNGQTYLRGMKIRVTTIADKTFEGIFLGVNNEDFFLVMTEKDLTADMMDNIADILLIENEEES